MIIPLGHSPDYDYRTYWIATIFLLRLKLNVLYRIYVNGDIDTDRNASAFPKGTIAASSRVL